MRDVRRFALFSLGVAHMLGVDDGSMTKDQREASLEKIRTNKSTRCILISFKAGSTGMFSPLMTGKSLNLCAPGLNLTCCNNVILVDMWWNPALEVCFRCRIFERGIDRWGRNKRSIGPTALGRRATSIFSSSLFPIPSKSESSR